MSGHDWTQLDDRRLDREDLGNHVCDGWTMAIEDYSAEQLTAIDAAVDELGLGGTLIPEGCG